MVGGTVEGDSGRVISGANTIEAAGQTDLAFASNKKAFASAKHSAAGCLLVPSVFGESGPWSLIRVAEPRVAFARALDAIYPKKKLMPGIHATAVIGTSASIASDCCIGSSVTIGEDTRIGSGCRIEHGCSVGDNVTIGENTILHANVVLYDRVSIGSRVIIHAGCVIGADGFGFTLSGDHYEKFPQVGTVEIGDDVELGANCCVDRAALGITKIGNGSKFDNLVHVAHNCQIGHHVVVAAQTGFSGSVTVGDYAVIGGQVGIGEKARIEARAIVGGKSGVLTSQVIHAGEPVWGIPARPLRRHLKGLAYVERLSELNETVRELKHRFEDLELDRKRELLKEG
jgi:UDP-3-O-[3-hydroxymyristoyl] glucosamine N-acyltransferase